MIEEKNYDLPVAVGAGLAVGSPFLGLIGQRKLVHDPHINENIRKLTLKELGRQARPGDVVLSSRPRWGGFKVTQTPVSGSEFYHASPVYGRRGGLGTIIDAGDFGYDNPPRPTISGVSRIATPAPRHFSGHGYSDLVLMRPDKKLSPAQLKKLQKALTARAYQQYSVPVGAKAMLKELFVPKIKAFSKDLAKSTPEAIRCSGTMCSALPSEAMAEAGILKNIAKGKGPSEVLPADFLRAGSGYSPVGAVIKQKRALSAVSRALYPYAARAGIGLGIGGTIYGTYKDPVATAGVLGGMMTPSIMRALATRAVQYGQHKTKNEAMSAVGNQLPKLKRLVLEAFTPDPEITPELARKLKLRFATRTLPIGLLGGLGSFLAAKKIRSMFSKDDQ